MHSSHHAGTSQPLTVRVCAVLALALAAVVLGPARPAVAAPRDLSAACPTAPSGWNEPDNNPQIWGPEQEPGTTSENVNCWYYNADHSKSVMVSAEFALPSDMNPINDFYYGCGSNGSVSWDAQNRQYRVTSTNRWLYVTFNDATQRAIPDNQVNTFESLAKTLLNNTESAAHTCSLKTVPTSTQAGWLFDFEFSFRGNGVIAYGGIGTHNPGIIGAAPLPDGTFTTAGEGSNPKVGKLHTPPILVAVVKNGKKTSMTLRLGKGLSFTYKLVAEGTVSAATLKAQVRVSRSTEPSCKAGSKGTITFTSAPANVALDLCGGFFKTASHKASVTIEEN
jgi:hypothetical protein